MTNSILTHSHTHWHAHTQTHNAHTHFSASQPTDIAYAGIKFQIIIVYTIGMQNEFCACFRAAIYVYRTRTAFREYYLPTQTRAYWTFPSENPKIIPFIPHSFGSYSLLFTHFKSHLACVPNFQNYHWKCCYLSAHFVRWDFGEMFINSLPLPLLLIFSVWLNPFASIFARLGYAQMFRIFFAHSTFFTSFSEGNSRIVTYNGSTDAYISSNCMRSYQIVEAMPQPTNSSTLLLINKMSIDVIYEKCLIWKIIPNDICDIFDNFMSSQYCRRCRCLPCQYSRINMLETGNSACN